MLQCIVWHYIPSDLSDLYHIISYRKAQAPVLVGIHLRILSFSRLSKGTRRAQAGVLNWVRSRGQGVTGQQKFMPTPNGGGRGATKHTLTLYKYSKGCYMRYVGAHIYLYIHTQYTHYVREGVCVCMCVCVCVLAFPLCVSSCWVCCSLLSASSD